MHLFAPLTTCVVSKYNQIQYKEILQSYVIP